MKTAKGAMSVLITLTLVFGCLAAPVFITQATAAATVIGDVANPISGFTSFINTLKNFFTSITLMFSRMSGESCVISAENHTQLSLAQEGDTIRLTSDISCPEISISSAVNLELNGHTITTNKFTYSTGSSRAVYIRNGTIYATRGDITINLPNASVDIDSVTFAVNSSSQQISADTAVNTLILRNGTRFVDINEGISELGSAISSGSRTPIVILGNSRAVLDSSLSYPFSLKVAADNVVIENYSQKSENSITIGNSVSGDVTIINYGKLASITNEQDARIQITNSGSIAYLRNTGAFSMNFTGDSPDSHEGQVFINGVSMWGTDDDLSWYDSAESTYILKDAADFAGMYRLYRDGNDFAGKTIYLNSSVDLANMPADLAVDTVFRGIFDAKGNTLYNLNIDIGEPTGGSYALFPKTENAVIRGCNFENAVISGGNATAADEESHGTAIIVGLAGNNTVIENCNIKNSSIGDKTGFDRVCVGFITGNAAGRNIKINNCGVADCCGATAGKYIGGIVGKLSGYAAGSESLPEISGCTVTSTEIVSLPGVSEGGFAGGIAGAIYLGSVSLCTVDTVNITAEKEAGGFAGAIGAIPGRPVLFSLFKNTITDNKVKNTDITITDKNGGGFVGTVTHANIFTECSVENSTLTVTDGFRGSFGGFAGKNDAYSTFTLCHVNGMILTLDTTKSITAAGGFAGTNLTGQQNVQNNFASFSSGYRNCVADNITITSPSGAAAANEGGFIGNTEGAYFTSCFVKKANLGLNAASQGKFCARALSGTAYIASDGSAPYGQLNTYIEGCVITGPVTGADVNIGFLSEGSRSNL